ncbi:MAG TPA: class I SAM-dependent methyltransferase [Allosphingosinicella sp.]|nr:class I SAM-dependent methyltransferase [Allosphingosinicella sp.]
MLHLMELSRRELLAAAAALPALGGFAQPRELEVPFVPTPHALVQRMLDLAEVGAADYLIDLGCGDGRIAVAAAQRGARALGVDLDPLRIEEAAAAARIAGVEARARFRRQDLFRTPIFDASVVALYLLPRINLALRPRLLTELRPGARIVSHAFDMGDWRPEAEETLDGRRIFLWLVPAVAGGSWTLTEADGAVSMLEVEQRFQRVAGTLTAGGGVTELEGALRGAALRFTAGGRTYSGTVGDAAIAGEGGWRAVRAG